MPWTKTQIQIAARACRDGGIADEHRKLILRQLPHALFDRSGGASKAPSSTSAKLTNSDFERFMATVEDYCGGQVKIPGRGRVYLYVRGHWSVRSSDPSRRLRHKAGELVRRLEADGRLEPRGVGVRGWIRKYISPDASGIDDLVCDQLHALIHGLTAYCRRTPI
jgi:hypothetical protein